MIDYANECHNDNHEPGCTCGYVPMPPMTPEQCAQVLNLYADYRTVYVHPKARHLGAFNDSATSRHDQDLILEIASFRWAARLLLDMDAPPINLPSWHYDDWLPNIERIRRGEKPIGPPNVDPQQDVG